MKRLLIALVLLSATAFGQSVGTVFFQASYSQSAGTVAIPTFNNGTGSYSGSATVTISDSTDSASIFYCTAVGSDCTPGTAYTVPVVISVTNTHLCANATKSGYTTSATACATYTITASTPAPAFVQQCNASQSWGTTVSCTLNGVGSGNVLLIAVRTNISSTLNGLSDSNGTVGSIIVSSSSSGLSSRLSAYSVNNATSGTHTITATIAADSSMNISVSEYSGVSTNPIDAYSSFDCESSCPNPVQTGTIVTMQENDMIWAMGKSAGGSGLTIGSGWTQRTAFTDATTILEDKATTTAGNYTASWANSGLSPAYGIAVAIKHP